MVATKEVKKKSGSIRTEKFEMDDNLLVGVITRQAGSLMKAVSEAVMNSIDAGATTVKVTVTSKKVIIEDDGKGFQTEEQIAKWFGRFGTPHEAEEKKVYGTFRMGRGQGFVFGRNLWRSGEFSMDVDFRKRGISYELETGLDHHPGCRVEIALYDVMGSWSVDYTISEIKAAVQFVSTTVLVNGKQVNTPVSGVKWDHEQDDFVVNLRDTQQMKVYSLGVFVRSYPAGTFGGGGVIVTNKALRLNFARNDVLTSECQLWKKIKEYIGGQIDKTSKTKPLTEAARIRLAERMRAGTLSDREAWEAPVFRDAMKRWWSLEKISGSFGRYPVVSAHRETGGKADTIMQHRLALVLDSSWLSEYFGAIDYDELFKETIEPLAEKMECEWSIKYKDFHDISAGLDETYEIVPEDKWTPTEKLIVDTLSGISAGLAYAMNNFVGGKGSDVTIRKVVVGVSGTCNGWTDGQTYVAVNRDYLKTCGVGIEGWVQMVRLMFHEYCHGSPSVATHNHSPEFYEQFHEMTKSYLGKIVEEAINRYARVVQAAGKKLTRAQMKKADQLAAAEKTRLRVEENAA